MSEENKNLIGSIPLMNPICNAMGGYITSSDQIYDSKRDRSQEEVNDDLYTKIGSGSGSTTVITVGEKDWFYIRTNGQLPEGAFNSIIPEKSGGELEGDSDYQEDNWMPGEIVVPGFVCSDWTKTQQGISNEWTVEYETYRQTYALGEKLFWDKLRYPTIRSMKGEPGNDAVAPAGVLTSFIFQQSAEKPERPSAEEVVIDGVAYNNYNNPVPPKSEGWTDGIVTNGSLDPIYFSKRTFTSNKEGQDSEWSDPTIISDTADIEYMFSNLKEDTGEGLKHEYVDGGTTIKFNKNNAEGINGDWLKLANENGWYDEVREIESLADSTKRTVWRMAITKRNGSSNDWSPWEISQIRGEDGDNGTKFTIKDHVPTYNDLPKNGVEINDAYVVDEDGHLYIWDGDSWTDCGKFSGEDGKSYYLHIIYANLYKESDEEGVFQATVGGAPLWLKLTEGLGETSGDYVGTFADSNEEDPKDKNSLETKYKWQFWKGEDGFGVEYIYIATEEFTAPKVPEAEYDKPEWNDFDFVPEGWKDNPISVDGSKGQKYCWVCHRTFANSQWNEWKGKDGYATLYSSYSKDIQPNLLLNSGFDRYTEVANINPPTDSTPTEEPTTPTPTPEETTTTTTPAPDQTTTPTPTPIALTAEEGSSNFDPFLCPYTNRYKIENWSCPDNGVNLALDEGIDGTTVLWVNQVVQGKISIIESLVVYLDDFNKDGADLYTLSFYVKGKAKLNVEILDEDNNSNLVWSSTDIIIDREKTTQKTCDYSWDINTQLEDSIGKWERHSLTFGIDEVIRKAVKVRFSFAVKEGDTLENHQSILLCMPKLERSEIATAWCANRADLTGEGLGIFNSTVFTRTADLTTPDKPEGGYYYNPYPIDENWTDGIPAFDSEKPYVWSSVATFRSNDPIDKTAEWSKPKLMVDSDSMDIEWSCIIENPGNPESNPDNWFNNVDDAGENQEIYWMAVRYKKAGSDGWGDWIISKIKGENGKNGLSPEENLLDNTSQFDENWSNSTTASSLWEIKEGGLSGHKIEYCNQTSNTVSLSTPFSQVITNKLTKNCWHVLSFYVKGTGTVAVFIKDVKDSAYTVVDRSEFYLDGKASSIGSDGGHNYTLGEENKDKWIRRYAVFKTNSENWNESEVQLRFSVRKVSEVSICMPKLERVEDQNNPQAAMPTPWCKSQNDLKGGEGPAGERGPLLYPQGTWVASETYTRTTESAPFVYHEKTEKYYVLEKEGNCSGIEPGTEAGKAYWGEFTNIKYVFTEALMAKWAKLGKAVFYGDYMFSQDGVTDGGKNCKYSEIENKDNIFDDNEKLSDKFTPNLFMDFVDGSLKVGKFSESFTRVDPVLTDGGEYIIPQKIHELDLSGNHNITYSTISNLVSNGAIGLSGVVKMPTLKDGDNKNLINGSHCTIIHEYNSAYSSDIMNPNYLNTTVMVCADDIFFNPEDTENFELKVVKSTDNWFLWRGYRTKFIMMAPGSILKLRASISESPDLNEEGEFIIESGKIKTRTNLIWFVENSNEFELLDARLYVHSEDPIIINDSYLMCLNSFKNSSIQEISDPDRAESAILGSPVYNSNAFKHPQYSDQTETKTEWIWSLKGDIETNGILSYLRETRFEYGESNYIEQTDLLNNEENNI